MHSFHFLRPYWLLTLIPLVIILWQLRHRAKGGDNWRQVCDPHLLVHLLDKAGTKQSYWTLLLVGIGWLLSVVALAGPSWTQLSQNVYRSLTATVIVLDLSESMLAKDVKPSRIARAKYKLLDILKHKHEGRTALVVFTREAFVVSPLTQDTETIAAMVPVLKPGLTPVMGSNISAGLNKAQQLITQGGQTGGEIYLITDSQPTPADLVLAARLSAHGTRLSILGIGSTKGAPIRIQGRFLRNAQGNMILSKLNPRKLQELAKKGGGHYIPFTNNNQDITTLFADKKTASLFAATEESKQTLAAWQDQGPYFCLLLLPLALLAFRYRL